MPPNHYAGYVFLTWGQILLFMGHIQQMKQECG